MQDVPSIRQLMDEAQQWYCAGHVDCAVMIWQQVLTLAPDVAMARANLGIVYVKRGQFHVGLRELMIALRQNARLGAAWQAAGVAYLRLGQNYKALTALDKAVVLQPDEWQGFYHRAYVHGLLKNFALALNDYTQVLHIQPRSRDSLNNRGNVFMDLGRYSEAVVDFTSLIDYWPDDALAYYNRALAYVAMGDLLRAAWDLVLACDLAPDFLEARYNLACVYARMGNFEQARAELQVAQNLDKTIETQAKDDPDLSVLFLEQRHG